MLRRITNSCSVHTEHCVFLARFCIFLFYGKYVPEGFIDAHLGGFLGSLDAEAFLKRPPAFAFSQNTKSHPVEFLLWVNLFDVKDWFCRRCGVKLEFFCRSFEIRRDRCFPWSAWMWQGVSDTKHCGRALLRKRPQMWNKACLSNNDSKKGSVSINILVFFNWL